MLKVLGLSFAAALAFSALPAQADEGTGPYCIEQHQNLNWDCSQPSYEQCRISTINDTAGRCVPNLNYHATQKPKRH